MQHSRKLVYDYEIKNNYIAKPKVYDKDKWSLPNKSNRLTAFLDFVIYRCIHLSRAFPPPCYSCIVSAINARAERIIYFHAIGCDEQLALCKFISHNLAFRYAIITRHCR